MGLNIILLLFCLLLLYRTPQYANSDCMELRSNGTFWKSIIPIRSLQTCTAASVCDWLCSWQHGDSGLPFRKKYVKHFWQFNLSHRAWLCAVHDLGCGSFSGRGVALQTLHYLHSSFRPEWRESLHCTRSGSYRLCWYSDHCCRSGRSEGTHLCLRLKLKRIELMWRTWNYSLSPSISKPITLI